VPSTADLEALRHGAEEDLAELLERPGALRQHAAQKREALGVRIERVRIHAHAPGAERLEPIAADVLGLPLDVPEAEVQREPVVDLQPAVVGPALLVRNADCRDPGRVARLLLLDEGLDELHRLGGAAQLELWLGAVALPVDAGTVHRHEQARVRVLVRDGGDTRAVKGEVGRHLHVEKVERPAHGRLDQGCLLPDRPPVVVPLGRDDERRVSWPGLCPPARARGREVGVIRLEHDMPGIADVAHDHGDPTLLALQM
jgi:hypothetical protein